MRKKPKTKYEYNQERVRDFRWGKAETSTAAAAKVLALFIQMYSYLKCAVLSG
jgi:hypothetical protein